MTAADDILSKMCTPPALVADNEDWCVERRAVPAKHRLSLLDRIYVERGTKDDWDLLHELHYKAENLGIGPKIYRCVLDGQVIGVGVMTVPKMLLSGRNQVFDHLRPNQNGRDTRLMNQYRAEWINAHSCTNSRLVLDTMFRGAGIAYRMQNLMMRMTGCRFVEFQSSMSKFNPFAAKAGMRFTKPKRSANYEKGLVFFSRWFKSAPMDYVGIKTELDTFPAAVRAKCVDEMRKFYYRCSSMEKSGDNRANGTSRVEAMEVGYLIKSLQQLVLASPLYGVYLNPDFGRALPERLAVLEFDRQAVTEPLATV
jgi:ABC-type ATPase with predicted acetyltransferase domain